MDYKKLMEDKIKEFEGFDEGVHIDKTGNPTTGYGFNLNAPGTKELIQEYGIDPAALITGEAKMSREIAEDIFRKRKDELDSVLDRRFQNKGIVPKIDERQMEVVRGINYNAPKLIGPNFSDAIGRGDIQTAAKELLLRSNRLKDPGIQKRRLEETQLFVGEDNFDQFLDSLTPEELNQVSDLLSQIDNQGTRDEVFQKFPRFKKETAPPVQFNKLKKMFE